MVAPAEPPTLESTRTDNNMTSDFPGRRLAFALALAGTLTACAIKPTVTEHKDVIELAPTEQAPLVTPAKSASTMREALACMDRMLAREQLPSTLIAVKTIPDPSGLFSTGTKEMIITALSRMSRTSQAFRVVDYEIDVLKQDTVQTLTSLLLNNGQLELRKPQIYVSGAISFGDKSVVQKRSSLGVSTNSTDAAYSWDALGTVVGLDLHLGDMNTRTLFSGLDSANELVVASGGKTVELGGRATGLPRHIYQIGVQFERGADNNQGAGAAVRLLVDLAAIELVGKWARVPYWDCVEYEQNHPEFKRQLRAWYDELSPTERISLAQRVLDAQGLWGGDVSGTDSPALRRALAGYQSSMDLTPVGTVTYETYAALMSAYVGMSADDQLVPPAPPRPDALEARPGGISRNEPDPKAIAVGIVGTREPVLTVGDTVVLRIAPARSAYLYCYYQDAAGAITQIYPNPQQPAPRAQGKMGLLVPDISQEGSFLIQATEPGIERAYCAGAQQPLNDALAPELTQARLEPLKGYADLDAVRQALEGSGQVVGSGQAEWRVDGLEPAVAPAPAAGSGKGAS